MWNDLNKYWKEVTSLAWHAYNRGTIPVGAVIANGEGTIVAKGSNVIYDGKSSHVMAGTGMGHAEIVALMQLKKFEHPDIGTYKMYVGLEPCPMCFGTMAMVGIRNLYYAADDVTEGISRLEHKEGSFAAFDRVNITKTNGDIEIFQIVMQTSRGQYNPRKETVNAWERKFQNAVILGTRLFNQSYFKQAIEKRREISDIFDEVINMYNNNTNTFF